MMESLNNSSYNHNYNNLQGTNNDFNSTKTDSDLPLSFSPVPNQSASYSSPKEIKKKIFKIIVIGDSNVGKTCLTYRFCEGKFPHKTEATIGVDFREKTLEIGNDLIKLQIWDTAGQERFRRSMIPHYYRNAHAIIFVYDVTNLKSFENLSIWIEECLQNGIETETPRIMIGNKCEESDNQKVSTSLAQRFADSHHMPLFETSALDDHKSDHIGSIFMTLAHKLNSNKSILFSHDTKDTKKLTEENNLIEEESTYCYC